MKWGSLLALGAAAGVAAAGAWLYRENTAVDVEAFPIFIRNLPAAFEGAKIAVVADVHLPNTTWPPRRLANLVAIQKPDAIFIPGDLTNEYAGRFDAEGLSELASRLAEIAPCFAVPGNHEWRAGRVDDYAEILWSAGVTVLCDEFTRWEHGGDSVALYGAYQRLCPKRADTDEPVLALAHLPQKLEDYAHAGLDLVVTGHAHGGQIRIFGQGLYAPGQGMLPTKTSGLYRQDDTCMVVSRGLGNSSFGFRLGNRLHLPMVVLFRDPDGEAEPAFEVKDDAEFI